MKSNDYNSENYFSTSTQKKEEFIQFYNNQNENQNENENKKTTLNEKYLKNLRVK
jgi:hypothetical protein